LSLLQWPLASLEFQVGEWRVTNDGGQAYALERLIQYHGSRLANTGTLNQSCGTRSMQDDCRRLPDVLMFCSIQSESFCCSPGTVDRASVDLSRGDREGEGAEPWERLQARLTYLRRVRSVSLNVSS
jgi:hypothetical protein